MSQASLVGRSSLHRKRNEKKKVKRKKERKEVKAKLDKGIFPPCESVSQEKGKRKEETRDKESKWKKEKRNKFIYQPRGLVKIINYNYFTAQLTSTFYVFCHLGNLWGAILCSRKESEMFSPADPASVIRDPINQYRHSVFYIITYILVLCLFLSPWLRFHVTNMS